MVGVAVRLRCAHLRNWKRTFQRRFPAPGIRLDPRFPYRLKSLELIPPAEFLA